MLQNIWGHFLLGICPSAVLYFVVKVNKNFTKHRFVLEDRDLYVNILFLDLKNTNLAVMTVLIS